MFVNSGLVVMLAKPCCGHYSLPFLLISLHFQAAFAGRESERAYVCVCVLVCVEGASASGSGQALGQAADL